MPQRLAFGERLDRLVGERDAEQRAGAGRAGLAHLAEAGDDQLIALHEQTIGARQRFVLQPGLELAVGKLPDRVGAGVGDEHLIVGADGDVVQELGVRGGVLLEDLAFFDVDLDQLVDVGDVELALAQARGPWGRRGR